MLSWVAASAVVFGLRFAHADGPAPSERAKQWLAHQISADSDDRKGKAEIARDATIFDRSGDPESGAFNESHGDSKLGKQIVGGTTDAAWIVADLVQPYSLLDCPVPLARCHKKRPLRVTGLIADTGAGFQLVAAHVQATGITGGMSSAELPVTTTPGPLSALLADPAALEAALADDPNVVVLGTESKERAVGKPAARKLLASWRKLKLSIAGKPREVHGARWGYAAANVDWTRKSDDVLHLRATVFATSTDGKTWRVVVAHYSFADQRDY